MTSVSPHKANQDNTQQIRVEFRDARTHDIILVRHIHIHELPESFAPTTEIDLGLGIWHVVSASPQHKPEFAQSGELELWLERATPNTRTSTRRATPEHEVLFAPLSQHKLPTLDPLPEHDEEASDFLFLYEEDWLTNQLLPTHLQSNIRKEFGHIARTPMGMTHTLSAVAGTTFPFDLDELVELLDAAYFDGLVLCQHSSEQLVRDGYAIETARGTHIYGRTHTHQNSPALTEIAIHYWEERENLLDDLRQLATWLGPRAEQFVFVSWESQSLISLSEL